MEVRIGVRTKDGWQSAQLTGRAAELVLPAFGLKCTVGQLYEGTPPQPRDIPQPRA
jgi:hypothetical protein